MNPVTADQIRKSFRNASRSQAAAATVPTRLDTLEWDQRDFLGWGDEKFPNRAYLAVPWEDGLVTLLLRAPSASVGRPGRGVCSICHTTRPSDEVVLFVAPRAGAAGKAGNTVGTYICEDLACSLYARGLLTTELPQPGTASVEDKVARVRETIAGFVGRVLES